MAHSFGDLSAFVFGDHALHLREQFALRGIAEWVLEKDQLGVELLELLNEQPLMGIVARQTIRREHDYGVEFAAPGAVTQSIQRGAIESRATDSFIEKFMFRQQTPVLLLNVLFEKSYLGGNRAFLLSIESRDSGIDRYLHFVPPGVRQ